MSGDQNKKCGGLTVIGAEDFFAKPNVTKAKIKDVPPLTPIIALIVSRGDPNYRDPYPDFSGHFPPEDPLDTDPEQTVKKTKRATHTYSDLIKH